MSRKSDTPTAAELQILIALAGEPLHGYAIMQSVESLSEGRTRLGPGTLYTAIKRLLDRGWIEEAPLAEGDDERRRRYALTDGGRQVVDSETREWSRLARIVQRRLAEGGAA